MWTKFWDMHSGGSQKLEWSKIYIEAPEEEAKVIFYNRFGRSPDRVTCTCCGEDYSTDESPTLEQATGYHRGCAYEDDGYVERADTKWNKTYLTLTEYLSSPDVKVIYAHDIDPDERRGELPEEGYVW